MLLDKLDDILFYYRVQRHYPPAGTLCQFRWTNHHVYECMVISNHPNNRAIILEILNHSMYKGYIILTTLGRHLFRPWPRFCMATVLKNNTAEDWVNGYKMGKCNMRPLKIHNTPMSTSILLTTLSSFDITPILDKRVFLKPHTIFNVYDWQIPILKMNKASTTIQRQWHNSISNPKYKMCIKRLKKEFQELV